MPRSTISGTAIDLDGKEMILDADQDTTITADTDDTIDFKIAGVEHISLSNSSGDTVIKPRVDTKEIIFQQFDGNEVARITDGRKLKFFDDGGESITSDGSNLKLESGGTTFTVPDTDGSNGQFMKTNGSGVLSFGSVSSAADDLTTGDAAVTLATSAGNITIDAQGDNTDIIFKGTDDGADITMLTLDGSAAGAAIFNVGATFGGALLPAADDTHDLGSSSKQWRDIYTGDINLNNTKTRDNEVDGTRGSWTIQEGKDDLYILNRLNGKKYRFKLEEMK